MDTLEQMDDLSLLTALIMGEAEAEPLIGKFAVACVVRNRLSDNRWPDLWSRVILQKYQFSCFLPSYLRPEITQEHWEDINWRECRFVAFGVYSNLVKDITEGANHYYASWMNKPPKWAENKVHTVGIGQHLFFKL